MKYFKKSGLIITLLISVNLFGQKKSISIELILTNLPDHKKFYLLDFDKETQVRDSAYSSNGNIIFKTVYDGPFAAAISEEGQSGTPNPMRIFTLFVDDQPVRINGDYPDFSKTVVNNKLNEINKFSYSLTDSLNNFYKSNGPPNGPGEYERYNGIMANYQAVYDKSILMYVLENPNLFSSLYVFSRSLTSYATDTIRIYYNLLDSLNQSGKFGRKIKAHLEGFKKINIGQFYIDIKAINKENDTVQLSDFAGKVILLDFWSAGCAPCIMQKKYLRELCIGKHDSGLVIVSFSLDINSKIFIQSIEGEPWINITDYKGFFSDAAIKYGISSMPSLFLIDRKGIIRGKYEGFAFGPDANKDKNELISKLLKEK